MFIRLSVLIFPFFLNAQVVTTLPEFAWVVKKLAPSLKVNSLLNGSEDPHFVDATPSFIFKVAKAKLLIRNGLQLEDAWLNKVLELSGNAVVQNKGNCNAGRDIKPLEILKNYDRSMGDVHAVGNPHYSLSPKRMMVVVKTIKNCLALNFKKLKKIEKNYSSLMKSLKELSSKFKISKRPYYVYHREFSYLKNDYGLSILESLERTPGVLPSASYLMKMTKKAKKHQPKFVLASINSSIKILNKFKELSGVNYKLFRLHPKPDEDYIQFIEKNIMELN